MRLRRCVYGKVSISRSTDCKIGAGGAHWRGFDCLGPSTGAARHIQAQLDLKGLQVEKTKFVDEDLSARFCDVLYRVPVRTGGETFIWILLEHQSSNDPLMPLRLLEYMVRAWTKLCRASAPQDDD